MTNDSVTLTANAAHPDSLLEAHPDAASPPVVVLYMVQTIDDSGGTSAVDESVLVAEIVRRVLAGDISDMARKLLLMALKQKRPALAD